ncbi:MAG: sigma-70 family RNA polymerase sigma factor [Chitinophagaceae bacterium]
MYKQFYPALFALCKTFFADNHDILTALNNGMLKVFKNIDQFDAAKGTLFNWAYTVVRNSSLTLIRDKKTQASLELKESLPDVVEINPFREKGWNDIYSLLAKLPPVTRAVCSLFYLEDYSINEISASLEMKEGTVKWHLSESRSRLRNIIQPNLNKSA